MNTILLASCLVGVLLLLLRQDPSSSFSSPEASLIMMQQQLQHTTNSHEDARQSSSSLLQGTPSDTQSRQSKQTQHSAASEVTTKGISDTIPLWHDMTESEQQTALQQVLPYLESFATVLSQTKRDGWRSQERCNITMMGSEWGSHPLCEPPSPYPNCHFVSFGIHRDYSFDTDMATKWTCRGFAADPTVDHKSHLHPLVTFQSLGANTLQENFDLAKLKNPFWTVSMPSVKRFLQLDRINVLKMDCEGCEYALARDILMEDPSFLHKVDQFTFEAHLNSLWMNTTETLYYYAVLFRLMEEAGLQLMMSAIGGCGWDNEEAASYPGLAKIRYPGQGITKLYQRRSCHNYLFARV